jgi:hypothetical protein
MNENSPLARLRPLPNKVVRNNSWIDREHNQEKWPAVKDFIESCTAAGETSLPRVLSLLKAWLHGSATDRTTEMCLDGECIGLPAASAVEDAVIYSRLAKICRPDTGALIDLGSGWGWRLFDLWNLGAVDRATHMYALEYTPVGRECNEMLKSLAPTLPMSIHPFDFYSPDYGPISNGRPKHIAAYSVYSIYHIPKLAPDIFLQLLNLADEVDCVLLEPVGFQFREEVGMVDRVGSSLAHAERNDFNRNLWDTLKRLEKEDRIKIEVAEPDLVGRNPTNALSHIRWRKVT